MDNDNFKTLIDREIEKVIAEEKKLYAEEGQLLKEIAELRAKEELAKEEDYRRNRRFITSFEIVNQRLIEPWSDPAELPERTTTHDIVSQHLLVEWSDPALLPKRKTTHDLAVEQLTVEHPPVEVGTLQNHAGVDYRYDGKQWVAVELS